MTGEREDPQATGGTLASEGPEPEAIAEVPGRQGADGRTGPLGGDGSRGRRSDGSRADGSRGDGSRGDGPGGGDEGDGYAPFVTFDEYDARHRVRVPRRRRIMRRVALVVGALIVVGLLAAAGTAWWVMRQIDPPGGPGQSLTIVVPNGASAAGIADLLEQSGVIRNSFIFREYIKVKGDGADGHFQPGRYTMSHDSSMSEALAELKKGPIPPATAQVTFPEGLRLTEISPRLATGVPWFTQPGVDAALGSVRSTLQPPDQPSLEGLLFPDTYTFQEGTTEVQAVTEMAKQMEAVGRELGLDAGAAKLGYTPYEVITIASMIEREAAVPEDRGKIARVIYNRLESGMRLDIDATVSYALGGTQRALSATDLEVDSPYNTRLYDGLPPTPIAAPGRASLEAALNPTPGDWLYYVVADKDGSHYFTDSYSDFNDAVAAAEAAGLIATVSGGTRTVAVIGHPVRYSLSPILHNAAFAECHLDWVYVAFDVDAGRAGDALQAMRTLGLGGLSVTMPHKADVAMAVDRLSPVAQRLAAVNCVRWDGPQLVGENTDGAGFVRSLAEDAAFDPVGRRCVVLGAGGAARAVVLALYDAGAAEVGVANRTQVRAEETAELAGSRRVVGLGDARSLRDADLLVNATSVGMGDTAASVDQMPLEPSCIRDGHVVVDLVYHPLRTALLRAADSRGAVAVSGVGMLLHQAGLAFEHWTGQAAPIAAMRRALLEQLRP